MTTSRIGAAMRARRLAAALTLRAVSRESGVSVSYLSDLERGIRAPSPEVLLQIANLYPGVDPGEWLWLALRDRWGDPVADLLAAHARATREVAP